MSTQGNIGNIPFAGQPAFPIQSTPCDPDCFGLTKREFIATQVLAGLLACIREHDGATDVQSRAQLAFEYADAVLAESEKAGGA